MTWKVIIGQLLRVLAGILEQLPVIAYLLANRDYNEITQRITEGEARGGLSDGRLSELMRQRKEAKALRDVLRAKAVQSIEGQSD